MGTTKNIWIGIVLALLIGLLFSLILMFQGHNPLFGAMIAVITILWFIRPTSPSRGRIAGLLVGALMGLLLAAISTVQPTAMPSIPGLEDRLINVLLGILLLSLAGAVYGDITTRIYLAYLEGTGPFF